MGGPGSGRPPIGDKKVAVEQCLAIDAARFVRRRSHKRGHWEWFDSYESVVHYELYTEDARGWLTLDYRPGAGGHARYSIGLQVTFPHFGGVRWWLTCPLTVNGQYCGRRVRKLYRPPGERFFGCRACFELTYLSSQTHDPRLSALVRRMLAGEVSPMAAENDPQLGARLCIYLLDRSGYHDSSWGEPLDISG